MGRMASYVFIASGEGVVGSERYQVGGGGVPVDLYEGRSTKVFVHHVVSVAWFTCSFILNIKKILDLRDHTYNLARCPRLLRLSP